MPKKDGPEESAHQKQHERKMTKNFEKKKNPKNNERGKNNR